MAQDFRNDIQRNVGTVPQQLLDAGNYDAVIGIRCCNVHASSTIALDVYIINGGDNYYIAKDVSVPPNSAIELIQGGAKIVLKRGDDLYAVSDFSSSVDIVTSYIYIISS